MPIHYGNIYCITGDESELAECSLRSAAGCNHAHDAGVTCLERTGMQLNYPTKYQF